MSAAHSGNIKIALHNIHLEVAHDTELVHITMKEKKEKEPKEYVRKAYAAKGERSQKMMSFRVDNENLEWLESQPNKGRYINNLIEKDRKERGA